MGPPIIDAIAGIPLTQNKISARNVLCTPPATQATRARKGCRQEEGGGPFTAAVSLLDPYHVAHGRVPTATALFVSSPSRACLTLTRKLH